MRFLGIVWTGGILLAGSVWGSNALLQPVVPSPSWLTDGVMYQIQPRAFTPEGTLRAATERLASLKDLGVTIVYLVPVMRMDEDMDKGFWSPRQVKSGFENPKNQYRISDYFHVDPEYGTDEDLRAFTARAHELGLKVLFDLVYFHCGPTARLIREFPETVVRAPDGTVRRGHWRFPQIDFAKPSAREYLLTNLMCLIADFGADGFRCDVGCAVPLDFWAEARRRMRALKADSVLLCEGYDEHGQLVAFDADYGWYPSRFLDGVAGVTAREIREKWERREHDSGRGAKFVNHYENHDLATNQDPRAERRWGTAAVEQVLVWMFTLDGVPLLFNGNEFADDDGRHSMFGRTPLDWSRLEGDPGRARLDFVRRLIALRRDRRSLREVNGADGLEWLDVSAADAVTAFRRRAGGERTVVVQNWTSNAVETAVAGADLSRAPLLARGCSVVDGKARLAPWGFAVLPESDASRSPLDLLLPRPARVVRREGAADAAALTRVTEEVADVGAPTGKPAEESYRLEIAPTGVRLTAPTPRGLRYARVTLRQLERLAAPGPVPACEIVDWPDLPWRGLLLDCGRNYAELPLVLETIDMLAHYKMNVFHWHLSDYHGWRLESRIYPELQAPRAFERQVGRYYTQDEFREVVAYAARRGVTVVPEIDVPGHSGAFRRAFGFRTMRDPGVDEKVCRLIDELCSLASAEEMPVIHLGTDEVRKDEEKASDASYERWARQVTANGRTVMGWWPGHVLETDGPVIQQTWYETVAPTGPYVDATCYYIDSFDPAGLLSQAAFKRPCSYPGDPRNRLGGEIQAWHDDPIETSGDLARDNPLFPAIVQFCDSYWRDLPTNRTDLIYCPPSPDAGGFDRLADLECRVLAQRDRVLTDLTRPFHFVAQTHMRWRIEDSAGRVLRSDIPSGIVYVRSPRAEWGYAGFTDAVTGTVSIVSSFVSPTEREAGAIVETSAFHRSGARAYGLPAQGQWNRYGARVMLNGECLKPPRWDRTSVPDDSLKAPPWSDESAWIRPPTPIRIRKGRNEVRIVLPKTDDVWYWCAAFIPVEGTRERPREIADLVYESAAAAAAKGRE